jgi:L-iditol 2-dehydrogenase
VVRRGGRDRIGGARAAVGRRRRGECVVGPAGRDHFGFSIDGADAEYFKARGEWLHKLPEGISFTEGAMVEPLSVAYNATVLAGGIDPADVVAVLGGGPIGLLCVMAAAANNATVVLLEPQTARRDKALQVGATAALDPSPATSSTASPSSPTVVASTSWSRRRAIPPPWRTRSRLRARRHGSST